MRRHNIIGIILAATVILASLIALSLKQTGLAPGTSETPAETAVEAQSPEPAAFDKSRYSTDDPASPWVIVNKARPLPNGYQPTDLRAPNVELRLGSGNAEMWLRAEAATALEKMFEAAKNDGINLMVASAFRSQATQLSLYNLYVSQDGQALADTYSARPRHSEHQTGWALDIEPVSRQCEVEVCFADLAEGQWAAVHAPEYGFVIRYGKDKSELTGYTYEPWHIRYVGVELANELVVSELTLEQYFGLPPATSY